MDPGFAILFKDKVCFARLGRLLKRLRHVRMPYHRLGHVVDLLVLEDGTDAEWDALIGQGPGCSTVHSDDILLGCQHQLLLGKGKNNRFCDDYEKKEKTLPEESQMIVTHYSGV